MTSYRMCSPCICGVGAVAPAVIRGSDRRFLTLRILAVEPVTEDVRGGSFCYHTDLEVADKAALVGFR